MEVKKQVCNLELAKRLKELGVPQFGTLFAWADTAIEIGEDGKWKFEPRVCQNTFQADIEFTAAFTVAELGEMLPNHTLSRPMGHEDVDVNEDYEPFMCKQYVAGNHAKYKQIFFAPTEADARAKMLICLVEHNLVSK
jgi:hypothetical protein